MTKIKGVNIVVLLMVIISISLSFLLGYIPISTNFRLIISQSVILIPALSYVFLTRQNLFKLIRFNKIGFLTIFLLFVFTYCLMPLLNLINTISMLFANNFIKDTAISVVGDNIVIGLIMLAFIPSVVEEVTYRGVIYNTYKGSRPLKGMLISALLFGAMHMNFNQFIYATILGFIMVLVLEATNSIVSTMIMHFIFNGNSAVLVYVMTKIEKFLNSFSGGESSKDLLSAEITRDQMMQAIIVLIPIAFIMTLAAIGLFILIAKINGRLEYIKSLFIRKINREYTLDSKDTKIIDIFLILAVVLCIGFSIWMEMRV